MFMKSEADWQAEHDAHVLKEAAEIKGDSKRMSRATDMMEKIAEEAKKTKEKIMDDVYPSMSEDK